jgi:hypothetical protein
MPQLLTGIAKKRSCDHRSPVRFVASWDSNVEVITLNLAKSKTWKHCPRRVYAGASQTLKVVFFDRLHLGWRRPNAAELRVHAKAGGDLAGK